MKMLIVTPLKRELDFLSNSIAQHRFDAAQSSIGRLPVIHYAELGITLAQGGLGKAQFAVQTQHLLDSSSDWDVVICAGAAGGLSNQIAIGDVVVATTTVEHDINNKFGPPLIPRFDAAPSKVADLRRAAQSPQSFKVHFGTVASGDEDVIEPDRRQTLQEALQALAVAWEGAGGARACAFSNVPFIEIRGVTDAANQSAATDFKNNLELAMDNIVTLILVWVKSI